MHGNGLARLDTRTIADDQIGEGLLGLVGCRRDRDGGRIGGVRLRDDRDGIDHERQGIARLDHVGPWRAVAVGEVGRDVELAASAGLHSHEAFVPTLDDLADADRDGERLSVVVTVVELCAVL